jgi:flagellar basal-body rod protein FlgF
MDRMIYLSMAGAKATCSARTCWPQPGQCVDHGLSRRDGGFRAVPVRGDGASTRVYALETTIGHDDGRPGATAPAALDVAMQGKPGWPCRGWTAPRPTRAPVIWRSTPKACWSPQRPAGAGRRRPRSRCRPNTTVEIAADGTISPRCGNGRPHHRGPPQAGDARAPLQRGRTACSAPPTAPTCRPTPRAVQAARWKAPTSAPSRPWWR